MIWIDLILNLALLVALSIVSGFINHRWERTTKKGALMQGALFGGAAVIGMLRPLVFAPGVIFDGRSVMISLGALFYGPWAAAVAALMTITCRLSLGGTGTTMGVLVIISSALIGLAAYYLYRRQTAPPSTRMLYLFGLVIHAAMVALMFTLPLNIAVATITSIGLPVILLYPLATILAGKILSDQVMTASILSDLRESNRLLDDTQSIAHMGGWRYNVSSKRVIWTDEVYRIHGVGRDYDPNNLSRTFSFYIPEHTPIIANAFRQAVEQGQPYDLELMLIRADVEHVWVRTIGKPVIVDNQVTGVTGNIMDITARKRVEERLRLSHAVLEALNHQKDSMKVVVHDILVLIQKFTSLEALGIRLRSGDDFPYYDTCGFPESFLQSEQFLCHQEGTNLVMRDDGGNPLPACMCGVVLRGRTDPALPCFSSNGSFWTNSCTHLLASIQPKEQFSPLRTACRSNGYESIALVPLHSGDEVIGLLQLNDRRPNRFTPEIIQFYEALGASIGIALAREQASLALSESELRYRTLANSGQALVWTSGTDMKCDYFNLPWLDFTGRSLEDELGDGWIEGVHPDDRERCIDVYSSSFNQRTHFNMVYRLRRHDGHYRWVQDNGTPRYDTEGNFLGFIGHCLDISERVLAEEKRQNMEEQFLQSQKMEAVGKLAGGIAHDFNNMLSIINGYAELALSSLEPATSVHENIKEILKAGQHAADLTRQLLAFARKQTIAPQDLDLNDTLASMLSILKRLIGENIELVWRPAPEACPVHMDPSQINQILTNLAVNARDAITDIGTLTIETANVDIDAAYCATHAQFVPGHFVMLAVSDTGYGMDKATIKSIFEPFFSTKKTGKGTGLGLATVFGIIKQNNGFLTVYSEPNQGTTFKLYLPRHSSAALTPDTLPPSAHTGLVTETVLLVEDESALLKLGQHMLEELGYSVLASESPVHALQLAEEYSGTIDLLMTDVIMPEMNGRELFLQLEPLCPGIKCLFMSGYTANVIAHHGVLDAGVHFLEKPFTHTKLTVALRQALDN